MSNIEIIVVQFQSQNIGDLQLSCPTCLDVNHCQIRQQLFVLVDIVDTGGSSGNLPFPSEKRDKGLGGITCNFESDL